MNHVDLQTLKHVQRATVYKQGTPAGTLSRTNSGGVRYEYHAEYLANGGQPISISLPTHSAPVETNNGALPAFFTGMLPEGHRITVLKNATKTSLGDELTLLLAVGGDVPGDVTIAPENQTPREPPALADTNHLDESDFTELARNVDLRAIPGVQNKASAAMLTTPVSTRTKHYLLKLDPLEHPHLVANEAAHLTAARGLKLPIARHSVVHDRLGTPGLLVERFDRLRDTNGATIRLPLEDATQILGLPPAAKYSIETEVVVAAMAEQCTAPVVARRNLYLQFLFAWLTGNGDLHAKNVSLLGSADQRFSVAPMYDLPCTLIYGDDTMALPIGGKIRKLKARDWADFAATLGLPVRAAAAANELALRAADRLAWEGLPFTGSPLNGALRELRFRRGELAR